MKQGTFDLLARLADEDLTRAGRARDAGRLRMRRALDDVKRAQARLDSAGVRWIPLDPRALPHVLSDRSAELLRLRQEHARATEGSEQEKRALRAVLRWRLILRRMAPCCVA